MTCLKAQGMITPFINNKLSVKELEEFLEHVNSCPDCREELEFYYTLLTGMKQLDEDKNLSNDFQLELSVKLKKAQDKVIHVKYTYYRKKTVLILFMIILAFLLGIRYAEESIENEIHNKYSKEVVFHPERDDFIQKQWENSLMQQAAQKKIMPTKQPKAK